MLTRLKNGRVAVPLTAAVLTPPAAAVPALTEPTQDGEQGPEVQVAIDPVDAEAMIAEALQAADDQGLTAPRADAEPEIPPGGVRSLVRRPPPFSTAHPGWIAE
jgi:hypothetical protein